MTNAQKTKTWHYADTVDGPVFDKEGENPWLRQPRGIAEQLQHGQAMQVLQVQWRREILATRRYLDLAPPPREERRLRELYSMDRDAPGADAILKDIAAQAERARNHAWSEALDKLEAAYRANG
jgi:hypothetical protein